MKRKVLKKTAAAVLAATVMLTGCGGGNDVSNLVNDATETAAPTQTADVTEPTQEEEAVDLLAYEDGTVLRMAVGYNNAKTGLRFDPEIAGEGVTLADGNTYKSGDFKPTWVEVMNVLNIDIDDQYTGLGDSDNFTYWEPNLTEIDIISGSAAQLQEAGAKGEVVNLTNYLDRMPNFKAFLDANPVARMSLTGSVDGDDAGALYNFPYFDGFDDIMKMPLMRADWVVALLDGDGEFTADSSDKTAAPVYQPYMPTSGKVEVEVVNAAGTGVEKVTKDYDATGNIIDKMNAAGSIDGVEAVNMLRTYIDEAYNGYYGTARSDLFIGQNAAWDADEVVALLRCVVANSATLNADGEKVQGIFSREEMKNNRRSDVYRLAGIMFGVRGLDSSNNLLYFEKDGTLKDARSEEATYEALFRMNDLVKEGLVSSDFVNATDDTTMKAETYIEKDLGFMSYDYNQTQTLFNENGKLDDDEKYMAVMIPVARWNDGNGETYMRFTESWRSAKPGGWAISAKGVEGDENKLNAALKLLDYAYSPEGQILMSYGPEAFRNDASTFEFHGVQMPHISDQTYSDLWSLAGGNYTNFARQYLGSTLSFNKSQAFEMECTTAVGKEGIQNIENAISLGVIKHVELSVQDNMWYTIVPTILPLTNEDNEVLGGYTELSSNFKTGSKIENNILLNVICRGTTAATKDEAGKTDAASAADMVLNDWNGKQYLSMNQTAWEELQVYADNNF